MKDVRMVMRNRKLLLSILAVMCIILGMSVFSAGAVESNIAENTGVTVTAQSTVDSAEKVGIAGNPATADQTVDSAKNYDNSNNANGAIATNEDNRTLQLFIIVIGIVAVAGVAYFVIQFRNKK